MNTNEIVIFTDGSSKGNPGPGGWAAIIKRNGKVEEMGGGEEYSTNNRMELTAAIEALKEISVTNAKIQINSDSKYLIDGITKWINNWKKYGWKTKDRKKVLNRDLWEMLDKLVTEKNIRWKHVAGHTGHPENERCDEIALMFAMGLPIKLNNAR